MCNFKIVRGYSIYRNNATGEAVISKPVKLSRSLRTAPVKSFYPNDNGLYNICGNVAEMVSKKGMAMGGSWNDYGCDIQIRAETKFEELQPTIGFRPAIFIREKND